MATPTHWLSFNLQNCEFCPSYPWKIAHFWDIQDSLLLAVPFPMPFLKKTKYVCFFLQASLTLQLQRKAIDHPHHQNSLRHQDGPICRSVHYIVISANIVGGVEVMSNLRNLFNQN